MVRAGLAPRRPEHAVDADGAGGAQVVDRLGDEGLAADEPVCVGARMFWRELLAQDGPEDGEQQRRHRDKQSELPHKAQSAHRRDHTRERAAHEPDADELDRRGLDADEGHDRNDPADDKGSHFSAPPYKF